MYVSGVRWTETADGSLQSHYHIKYAESSDGREWRREGQVAIDFENESETNIARPAVLKLVDGTYAMWYSLVGHPPGKYRMGLAHSRDCRTWTRVDAHAGIDVSPGTFDSDMLCYPCVVEHDARLYMFYNGNAFGADGFGLAVADVPRDIAALTRAIGPALIAGR